MEVQVFLAAEETITIMELFVRPKVRRTSLMGSWIVPAEMKRLDALYP
jgi:hypothetical protein